MDTVIRCSGFVALFERARGDGKMWSRRASFVCILIAAALCLPGVHFGGEDRT